MVSRICLLTLFVLAVPSQCARIKNIDREPDEIPVEELDVEIDTADVDNDEGGDAVNTGMFKDALARVQNHVEQLAEASKGGVAEIAVKVTQYASDVKDQAGILGWRILEEANMCNEQKRQKVAAAMAATRAKINQVAEMAVEKWPEVEEDARAFTKKSRQSVVELMQKLDTVKMTVMEREETQKLMKEVNGKFGRLQVMVLSRRPEYVLKAQEMVAEFTEKVSALSAKIVTVVRDAYEMETTQNALARIQAQAGQLLQAAAAKWPELRKMMGTIAKNAYALIETQTVKLREFMCSPETQARALELLTPVMEATNNLIQAIKDYLPVIKESVVKLAYQAAESAAHLKVRVLAYIGVTREAAPVNDGLSQMEETLQVMQSQVSTASYATSVETVTEQIGSLALTFSGWEGTTDLDASEVEADPETECFVADVKFHPANMEGTRRTHLNSAEECQALCANTEGCAHFSYWTNGGCHMQDSSATMRRAFNVIAGPPSCN